MSAAGVGRFIGFKSLHRKTSTASDGGNLLQLLTKTSPTASGEVLNFRSAKNFGRRKISKSCFNSVYGLNRNFLTVNIIGNASES